MDDSTGSDDQISASRTSISNDEARTVELTSTGSTGAPGFLEEHRGTGKFSGKYAPQPQQTELIWTMPWGCWVELEDKDVHCKEWGCIIENFTEEEADTTLHQIYGQRATLSVNSKPGDWESVRA